MSTLVCVVDDGGLLARVGETLSNSSEVEIVPSDYDPTAIAELVSSRRIDGCIFTPMSPDRFIGLRRSLASAPGAATAIRCGLLCKGADRALAYHKLAYGVDDVIETACSDDALRCSLEKFARGTELACESLLVSTVDIPFSIVHGEIRCVDEIDEKIIRLVSVGFTDREIGDILHFSHQAIRNRISHLLLRSGLRNRTQLAARYTVESIERGGKLQS